MQAPTKWVHDVVTEATEGHTGENQGWSQQNEKEQEFVHNYNASYVHQDSRLQ